MPPAFGLSHIWLNGDWITRGIMLMLLAMSLASWIVIVLKALDVWRYKQQAHKSEDFWHSHSLAEGLAVLGQGSGNLFHALATTGQEATDHHQAALETVQRWRYVPGKRNGSPEAMWFNVPVRFILE